MPTTITGTDGVSQVQAGAVESGDLPDGSVIQVVQNTKTDTSSSTSSSGSFGVSGLDVSITPTAATSKFLVIYSASIGSNTSQRSGTLLQRNIGGGSYSDIFIADAAGARLRGTTASEAIDDSVIVPHAANYLDSPSTTNVLNYRILIGVEGNQTVFMNRSSGDADASTLYRATSTITVMEIAG